MGVFGCLVLLMLAILSPFAKANSESDALTAFKKVLKDPHNVLASWDTTLETPCSWFHVKCDADNFVTRVDLGNENISGHLVPELGKLSRLKYLELYKNNIYGTIPAELGNLKNLISLDLSNNQLSGPIPASFGQLKSLVFLRMNNNKLSGPVPKEVATLPSLKIVDLSNNNLCGPIPTTKEFEGISFNNSPNC